MPPGGGAQISIRDAIALEAGCPAGRFKIEDSKFKIEAPNSGTSTQNPRSKIESLSSELLNLNAKSKIKD
jgi:hypothetical protein